MSTWQYSDWVTISDSTAKLARLNLHIQEVIDAGAGDPDVAADGKSVQRGNSNTYLDKLFKWQEKLETATGTGAADKYAVSSIQRRQ